MPALTESYIALREAHFNPEIIDPACALDDYKVIFSPYLPCIEHKNLADKLYKWIKNGGTWIAGPFTDIRNRHDGQYKEAPFGHLEKWANIRCEFSLPAAGASNIKFSSRVGYTTGHVVFDALTCQRNSPESKKFIKNENTGSEYGTATPMAVYTDNGYLKNYCAATVTEIGAHGGAYHCSRNNARVRRINRFYRKYFGVMRYQTGRGSKRKYSAHTQGRKTRKNCSYRSRNKKY